MQCSMHNTLKQLPGCQRGCWSRQIPVLLPMNWAGKTKAQLVIFMLCSTLMKSAKHSLKRCVAFKSTDPHIHALSQWKVPIQAAYVHILRTLDRGTVLAHYICWNCVASESTLPPLYSRTSLLTPPNRLYHFHLKGGGLWRKLGQKSQ